MDEERGRKRKRKSVTQTKCDLERIKERRRDAERREKGETICMIGRCLF